ncbi:PfkB family carbohydrate kinase [Arthrobacter sp. B6]|uniref:PfkB family carbohydrate kinase n=1 Tax=Arthrobacter sp. B6 TaxID=1570137 RepID=UPI002F915E37
MSKYGRKVAKAPSAEVAVANTVGAGGAFGAALVLALRSGLDYTRALAVANAVGADAVGDPSFHPDLVQLAITWSGPLLLPALHHDCYLPAGTAGGLP